jgi:membrane-associated protease RseP (regulator of RpoE activity)
MRAAAALRPAGRPQQGALASRPMERASLSPLTRTRPPALIAGVRTRSASIISSNRVGAGGAGVSVRPSSSSSAPSHLLARAAARDGLAATRSTVLASPPSAPALRDNDDEETDGGNVAGDEPEAATATSSPNSPTRRLLLAADPAASALALALALPAFGAVQGFSLAGPWSTVQALSVLAAVIAVHEAGHFAAARSLGVLVSRFCIGFGPTLVSWRPDVAEDDDEEEAEVVGKAGRGGGGGKTRAAAASSTPTLQQRRWPWQPAAAAAPAPPPPPPPPPASKSDDILSLIDRLRASLPGGGAESAKAAAAASSPPPPPPGPKPWPRGSVEYALCALPLGGYVAFPEPEDAAARERMQQQQQQEKQGGSAADDDSASRRPDPYYAPDDPDLLANRPVWQRLVVASAGVAFNCAFAFLTLLAQMLIVGKAEYDYLPGVKVPDVTRGGAAERAGLRAGDTVLRVGKASLGQGPGQVAAAVAQIKASTPGEPLELVVLVSAGGEGGLPSAPPLEAVSGEGGAASAATSALNTKTLLVTPVAGPRPPPASTPEEAMAQPPPSSQIGVSLVANTFVRHTRPETLADACRVAASEFTRLGGSVLSGLRSIVTDFRSASQQLSGPVAIVAAGSEIARADAAGLYQFCAVVNINLAAVNALPLPGLDGGFAALLMVEAARGGKKVSKGVEAGVMAGGLALLTLMGVALIVRDTARLLL